MHVVMKGKVAYCKECGGDAIPHRLTYFTIAIDETLRPLFSPGLGTRVTTRLIHALERHVTPSLLKFLVALGIAKIVEGPDEKTMLLSEMLYKEAGERGIHMREVRLFNLPRNLFLATFPWGKTIAFEGIPLPPDGLEQAWWMDNKAEMKKRFRKLGYPIARGGHAFTDEGALKVYRALTPPAIAKPFSGSASRHTTLHIVNELELLRAAHIARQIAPVALIEEELYGPVFRATVVEGKFVAALRRDPPHVIGDGERTIEMLVQEANTHPLRKGPYFHEMKLDDAALRELRYQHLTPESVPEKGRRVLLHQKVNWSVGGTTEDVTDEVHPENVTLFEEVTKTLRAPVVGYDFIIGDISRSWREQERCGFIEANSMPFFDNHHLPFSGTPRNVAACIWDMVERSYGKPQEEGVV